MSPKTTPKPTEPDTADGFVDSYVTTPAGFIADHVPDIRVDPTALRIDMIPIDSVRQHPRNNNVGDVEAIAESIKELGFFDPINVQKSTGYILTGNHSWQEYRRLGAAEIPAIMLDVDDVQAARILITHNRSNRRGHDDDATTLELLSWLQEEAGTDTVLQGTGYTADDVAQLLAAAAEPVVTVLDPVLPPDDDTPSAPPPEPVTVRGDVWELGDHRIICGDCRDYDTVTTLLDGARIDVAFTSPPYASQRVYDPSSGFEPIRPDDYEDWFEDVQANVRAHLADTGSWFVNIKEHAEDGQRHLYVKDLTIAHVRRWGWLFVDEFAWTRHAPPGRWPNRFKNEWEPVFHFATGGIKFHPERVGHQSTDIPVKISEDAGRKTSVNADHWNLSTESEPGVALPGNVISIYGVERDTGHTAAFPVKLPAWFIRAYSDPGDTVYDPFMGSGTTLLAAHTEGRTAYGCEISAGYCDVIAKRFQRHTGILPRRGGVAHDFLAETP